MLFTKSLLNPVEKIIQDGVMAEGNNVRGVLYNQLKCDDILDIFWIRIRMKWGYLFVSFTVRRSQTPSFKTE